MRKDRDDIILTILKAVFVFLILASLGFRIAEIVIRAKERNKIELEVNNLKKK